MATNISVTNLNVIFILTEPQLHVKYNILAVSKRKSKHSMLYRIQKYHTSLANHVYAVMLPKIFLFSFYCIEHSKIAFITTRTKFSKTE